MSEVQVNLQVDSSSLKFNTDGRTDGLTKKVVTEVDQLTVVTARANDDRMATLAQIIEAGVIRTGQRHERLRSGPRWPLSPHVRSAVWFRDRGSCELCPDRGRVKGAWECDHIVPWTAGGADDTTNLRVLCAIHNQQRSNFVDPLERPRRPATWWCANCYSRAWETRDRVPVCPRHVPEEWTLASGRDLAMRCRVMAAHIRELDEYGEVLGWHHRPRVEETFVVAYCAHCGVPAPTDKPL